VLAGGGGAVVPLLATRTGFCDLELLGSVCLGSLRFSVVSKLEGFCDSMWD
jgi:hypothetical protein